MAHGTEHEKKQKEALRRTYRTRRKKLSAKQQVDASYGLVRTARHFRALWNCKRILSYSAIANEINPSLLTSKLNAAIYHPKIINFRTGSMQFLPASNSTHLNRLGIAEPKNNIGQLSARHFDAVLVPLLAFDRQGNRLGMGGGFYDRAFSFKLNNQPARRPLMIGIAHHFQEASKIVTEPWDIPLEVIITDRELIVF